MTDSPELRGLLRSLVPLVDRSTAELNGQAVGNALYGIQKFGKTEEMQMLMVALTPKLRLCSRKLKAREWNFAKFSLQRLPRCRELDGLFEALNHGHQPPLAPPVESVGLIHG
jgi:hypothetical protein